jgi:hypothetical protein
MKKSTSQLLKKKQKEEEKRKGKTFVCQQLSIITVLQKVIRVT